MKLIDETDLAQEFGLPVEKVAELRRKHKWPHVRLTRFSVKYTETQVEAILERHTVRPKATTETATVATGQTSRSASRRRSA